MSIPALPWPVVAIVVAFIAAVTVLGVTHVVDSSLVGSILQMLVGALAATGGHAVGSNSTQRAMLADGRAMNAAGAAGKEDKS